MLIADRGAFSAGGVLSQGAFGDPDEEQAAVEEAAHVEGRGGAIDDVPHEGTQQEGAQLVEERTDHLGPLAFAERLVPLPKAAQLVVSS